MSIEAPTQNRGLPVETSEIAAPFLLQDILTNSGKAQIWDIPREDIEVAKTAIVLDHSFPGLSLHEKRRLFALRIWWHEEGDYGMIKRYMAEGTAPSWDSLIWSALDSEKRERSYIELENVLDVMDELAGDSRDIARYINIYRRFQALEERGLDDTTILEMKEDILNNRKQLEGVGIDRKEELFFRLRQTGITEELLRIKLRVTAERFQEIQDELLTQGFISS